MRRFIHAGLVAAARGALAVATTTLSLTLGAREGHARDFVISVPGIPGPYCAYGAEKRLLELPGVRKIDLLWQAEQIKVTVDDRSSVTAADIEKAVRRSDYPYGFTVTATP